MKLPAAIDFIGHRITVSLMDKVELAEKEVFGVAVFETEQIMVAKAVYKIVLSERAITEAFIHECFHHISEAFKLSLTERQVLCMARGWFAMARDNQIDILDTTHEVE